MKEQVLRMPPPHSLSKIIDYIWYVYRQDQDGVEDIIMPVGHMNIIINRGSPYYYKDHQQWRPAPRVAFIGQIERAQRVRYGETIDQMGIALKPIGFKRAFRQSPKVIADMVSDLSTLDTHLTFLMKADQQLSPAKEWVSYVYELLKPLGEKPLSPEEEWVDQVDEWIETHPEMTTVQLSEHMHVSMSTLERQFKKYFGITPKKYIDIIKFKHYMIGRPQSAYEVLGEAYYDQSHFIKKSKKYTQKTLGMLEEPIEEITLSELLEGESFLKTK